MDTHTLFHQLDDIAMPKGDATTFLSVGACVVVVTALLGIARNRPHWFLRPSLLVLTLYVLRVQFPSIFYLRAVSETLPTPWHYPLIIHGFSLLYLFFALPLFLVGDRHCLDAWCRMKRQIQAKLSCPPHFFVVLLIASIGTLAFYFLVLPFSETGLYHLFSDPTQLRQARETSWKLLPSRALTYIYGWNYATVAPLLLIGSTMIIVQHRRLQYIAVAAVAAFSMMLSANRASIGVAVLLVLLTYYFARDSKLRVGRSVVYLLIVATIASLGPAYITLRREGHEATPAMLADYTQRLLVGRALLTPAHTTRMYVYHAQTCGHVGLAGIRPVAGLINTPFVEVANMIGTTYVLGAGPTTICNTNFVGTYYLLFGLGTIPFCAVGLLAFDAFALVFRLRRLLILPFFLLFVSLAIPFSEGGFTGSALSGGFVLVPVLALLALLPRSLANAGSSYPPRALLDGATARSSG